MAGNMWKINKNEAKIKFIFVQIKGLTKEEKRDIIIKLSHESEDCRKKRKRICIAFDFEREFIKMK